MCQLYDEMKCCEDGTATIALDILQHSSLFWCLLGKRDK
jgi:hypothetical protein